MATPKKLPKPRTRYYINEPVIVVPMADYQRLIEHVTRMGMLKSYPDNVQSGIKSRNTLLLKEMRENIKRAKQHYLIPDK